MVDLRDVNAIIDALTLAGFRKWIILEDFHYLSAETQRKFAFNLKAFHENSALTFIVVAVWLNENKLLFYNGDLQGRIITIDADKWAENDLRRVIEAGEQLLYINFDQSFVSGLISGSFESVFIVQEACRRVCREAEIFETQQVQKKVAVGINPRDVIASIILESDGRYRSFLERFSSGFQTTSLEMYKWIIFVILTKAIREIERGVSYSEIIRILRHHHPEGTNLNAGNVSNALSSVGALQTKLHIRPFVLDYDETSRTLKCLDKSFLIWLDGQDRAALLSDFDLPKPV